MRPKKPYYHSFYLKCFRNVSPASPRILCVVKITIMTWKEGRTYFPNGYTKFDLNPY